jgi:hypothetical protein
VLPSSTTDASILDRASDTLVDMLAVLGVGTLSTSEILSETYTLALVFELPVAFSAPAEFDAAE